VAKKEDSVNQASAPRGAGESFPPVGRLSAPHGVNIMEFCKAYNAKTQQQTGTIIPWLSPCTTTRSFTLCHQNTARIGAADQGGGDTQGFSHAQS